MTAEQILRLEDGTEIALLGAPAQGTRHQVRFGRDRATGADVVVKLERIPGALDAEARALAWVGGRGAPAARLRGAGPARLSDGRAVSCLVCDRVSGGAPRTRTEWARLGRALAELARLPWVGSGLAVSGPDGFAVAHAARVAELGAPLARVLARIPDGRSLAAAELPAPGPLVVTHGDPGPGNVLVDGERAVLIDWEVTHVAPRGLDLARGMVIALLGAGPSGYVVRDRLGRARALARGYLEALDPAWTPSDRELRWWLTVAAVQFAHGRRERAGQPGVGPAAQAITALAEALSTFEEAC